MPEGVKSHKKLVEYHYKCNDCGDEFNSMNPNWKHCMECGSENIVRS